MIKLNPRIEEAIRNEISVQKQSEDVFDMLKNLIINIFNNNDDILEIEQLIKSLKLYAT